MFLYATTDLLQLMYGVLASFLVYEGEFGWLWLP
jgi:hypothetical protein